MSFTFPASASWLVPVNEAALSPTGSEIGVSGFRVVITGVGAGAFAGQLTEQSLFYDR